MGSVGNRNPWSPYDTYKDCSLGICSIYCPKFCYFIFPPPPPPSGEDSSSPFSPLIIAIIGLLASAFLLVSYYTIVTRYCKRTGNQNAGLEEHNHDEQWQQVASSGLDEAIIKTITVCKYERGQGLIEGTECAVCLTEFQENESLRLLPKCSHAFHLPCIDTWLKSQSSCPLCRANVTPPLPPIPNAQTSYDDHNHDVDSTEAQMPNDLILVVDDQELAGTDDVLKSPGVQDFGNAEERQRSGHQFRRSISLGAFPFERKLLISDVLKDESWRDIGSSMKRCNSTGRFMFIHQNKGKNSLLPHSMYIHS
ncbi:hypothetical protein ACS0TY_003433 [Phlomoides rotata]